MHKGAKDYLRIGDHNAWCDRCGFKFKASELRKEWQGFMVCAGCYEPRHPQEFVRSRPERPAPPWSRPRNDGPSLLIPRYPFIEPIEPIYITTESGLGLTTEGGESLITEDSSLPIFSTQPTMVDNAGSPLYFIPFGPADKSKL